MRHCEECGSTLYPDHEYRGGLCPICFEAALDEEEKLMQQKLEGEEYTGQEMARMAREAELDDMPF